MFSFFKNLFVNKPADDDSTVIEQAPAPRPQAATGAEPPVTEAPFRPRYPAPPAGTQLPAGAQPPTAAHPASPQRRTSPNTNGVLLPLYVVLSSLPLELKGRVRQPDVGDATICIPTEKVLSQLPSGTVKVPFGDLRRAAPQVFSSSGDCDQVQVSLPLSEILSRIDPALLVRRQDQRLVEIPEDVGSPFGDRGQGLAFSANPLKPSAQSPVVAPAPVPVPAPAPVRPTSPRVQPSPVQPTFRPVPQPAPIASAPAPSPIQAPAPFQPAPVQPAPIQSIPFRPATVRPAPIQPAPVHQTPAVPFQVFQRKPVHPTPAQPAPFQAAPIQPAPAPPSIQPIPVQPTPIQPAPSPFQPAPIPPAPTRGGITSTPAPPSTTVNEPIQSIQPSAQLRGLSASLAPALVETPGSRQGLPGESVVVPLAALTESWPEPLRLEILQMNLVEAKVNLPAATIEDSLKRGRIAFPWRTIRAWIVPAPSPTASPHDNSVLELPLKVVTPIFLARQKETHKSQHKVAIDENIPNLFFGFPQPEAPASSPVPSAAVATPPPSHAVAKPVDTNYYVWDDVSDSARVDETEFKRKPSPETSFVTRYATPNEVVSRAAALDGVAGALIALPDGLMVASRLAPDLNGDTLAAFLPHIFGKVSQCTKELRMGELNNLNFTVGNVPWKIFRVNAIFFAAFGRVGQPLPTAQLAALAAELDHKKQ